MLIPQLQTSRLILRELREQDLDAYAQMCGDPEVMRYIGAGNTLSRSESWRSMATILGHWQLRGYGMWAVEECETSEMIGRIGCWQPEGWAGFEIGWSLRRAYWGRGLATEGAKAALDYAFKELQQPYVLHLIRPENLASRRVAEKLGAKIRETIEILGSEALLYQIRRQDYEQRFWASQ